MAKRRIQLNLTREEVNNQYVSSIFEEFISEKKALGREYSTLKGYRNAYEEFNKYFGERAEETGNITSHMFIEWTNAMRDRGLAIPSINHYLSQVRIFMYWAMDEERQYIDRFKIRLVEAQEEPPKVYEVEEVKALLKKPDRNEKSFATWRSWAISCFVIGTGARLGTLVDIRLQDLNFKDGIVFYQHTKNKQVQYTNMSPKLMNILQEYIHICRNKAEPEDYLFSTATGEQMTRDALGASYRAYAKSRGISKTSIHGLRRTFAREWFLNGGDIVQLSKILGHSTLAMSEHYADIYAHMARDKFIQFNPLENIARTTSKQSIKPKAK